MESAIFYFSVIVIPVVAFVANIWIRSKNRVALSAAADLILLIMVFDVTAIISSNAFAEHISFQGWRAYVVLIHVAAFLSASLAWGFSITSVENKIASSYDSIDDKYTDFPLMRWIVAWMLAAMLISYHVFMYTIK